MADVRLTAINPEDSEVYPVACNDKGELVLSGATDIDVAFTLKVADTIYANGTGLFIGYGPDDPFNRTISLNKAGGAQFDGVVQTAGLVSYVRTDATDQNLASFNSNVGGLNVARILFQADGSATFASNVNLGGAVTSNRTSGTDNCFVGQLNVSTTSSITADGSATFASNLRTTNGIIQAVKDTSDNTGGVAGSTKPPADRPSLFTNLAVFTSGTAGTNTYLALGGYNKPGSSISTFGVTWDGKAQFAGNVTAPNITFKLAPETVAAMPAPLIDEGFAVNQELDLLSELIKMKLQIRDLNAFMQRTLQDETETQQ